MINSTERPLWIPVQEMLPVGSIGAELVSEIPTSGQRLRPKTILDQNYPYFFPSRELEWDGSLTFGDILRLPVEEIAKVTSRPTIIEDRLGNYLRSLRILPHSRLIWAIFDKPLFPAPINREQEIIEAVEAALNQVSYKKRTTLIAYFGLYTGFTQTLKEIGKEFTPVVPKSAVYQSKKDGLIALRRKAGAYLKGYLVLPKESFGKKVFRADLVKDLPELEGEEKFESLDLSPDVIEVIQNNGFSRFRDLSIKELVMADLSEVVGMDNFSLIEEEISLVLQERVRDVAEKQRREAEKKAQVEAQILASLRTIMRAKVAEKRGEPKNNLMPEIELSPEYLAILDGVPLANVGLNKPVFKSLRRGGSICTAGELLRKSKLDIKHIHNIGSTKLAHILEKMAEFLKSQQFTE